ncbi:MAG: hypothetical protein Q4D04_12270 [Clostridia bacterium]|nr:hypothetical protein [Clostridia bacterium]
MSSANRNEKIARLESYPSAFIAACLEDGHRRMDAYASRKDKWYTDCTLKCQNSDAGPRAGYAVTMRVGLPVEDFQGPTRFDLLRLIDESPKPVTLVIQVDEPEPTRNADSNFGGQYGHICNILGVENVICNGAIRDVEELKSFGMQMMIPGTIASTAPSMIYELNGEVEVAGMKVKAGDIIHMDMDGAVKFAPEMLDNLLTSAAEEKAAEDETNAIIEKAKTLDECLRAYEICHARCHPPKAEKA